MDWANNEDGPVCTCGYETMVKLSHDGPAVLLCLFHTPEEGCWFRLPEERPDDWPWSIERVISASAPN